MRVDPDKGESRRGWIMARTEATESICLQVLGYIDLSKRRVSAEEVVKCEEQYEKGRAVDSILTQVSKKRGSTTESLYEKIAFPLHKSYGHAYEAFKLSIRWVQRLRG